jgi:hypothetical protein
MLNWRVVGSLTAPSSAADPVATALVEAYDLGPTDDVY